MRRKGRQRQWNAPGLVFGVGVFLLILILGSFFLSRAYQNESTRTVSKMSQVYLQELTQHISTHFKTNMDSQFSQIDTIADYLHETELENTAELQEFLGRVQEENNFSQVAAITATGTAYSSTEAFPATSEISQINTLFAGEDRIFTFNETIWNTDMLILGIPIADKQVGEETLKAILVGIDTAIIDQKLALGNEGSDSYSSVISREGRFIIASINSQAAKYGDDFFSTLDTRAEFDSGYSLDELKSEVAAGDAAMVSMSMDGRHDYFYFSPIPDTQWYLCTSMSYATVNSQITSLSQFIMAMAGLVLLLMLMVILTVFTIYRKNQKKINSLLREEMAKAEAASQAKGDFLSQMSHEIRTPLNGILGMVELGWDETNDPGRMKNCLEKIRFSAQHLLSLVNDVLDMSKIESGKIELHEDLFDFGKLLKALMVVFYTQTKKKDVDLDVILSGKLEERLIGDSLRLNQVLTNLLSNALKFTSQGGKIVLGVREMSRDGRELWVQFSVRDDGCGISEESLDRIFQPFEQENSGVTRKYGGTGLGLPITKHFVEMMGGTITVESQVGNGSCFYVTMPFGYIESAGKSPGLGAGRRVLIVNQNPDIEAHLAPLLGMEGFVVDSTDSGDKAAAMTREACEEKRPYHFCLVEWDFPIGIKNVIDMIKEAAGKHPPLLVISGYDRDELDEARRLTGAHGTMIRPAFHDDIVTLLEELEFGAPATKKEKAAAALQGKKILVVEDNEINMEVATGLLENAGAEVTPACNGKEAIERFTAAHTGYYDLILMDMQMPEMDGCTATKIIREMPREDAKNTLIFAMTANAMEEDINKCLESGMNTHIGKPFSLEDIVTAYEKAASGE